MDHLQKNWSKKQKHTVICDKIFDKLAADSRRNLARPTWPDWSYHRFAIELFTKRKLLVSISLTYWLKTV